MLGYSCVIFSVCLLGFPCHVPQVFALWSQRSQLQIKLFGVRLSADSFLGTGVAATESSSSSSSAMRKSFSMGNLCNYGSPEGGASPPFASPLGQPDLSETVEGYASDDLVHASSNLRERKKGVPWTEEEHRTFLIGLQKLGKGDWRGISHNFVKTRTPTQVASHAQKYFLRRNNMTKRWRRSSLFDITPDTKRNKKFEEERKQKKHRKHNKDKYVHQKRGRTCGKKSERRKKSSTSDRSTDSTDCSRIDEEKKLKQFSSKKGRFSDPSSSSDTQSEKHSLLSGSGSDGDTSKGIKDCSAAARKAVGLEWMVHAPPSNMRKNELEMAPKDIQLEEKLRVNPKELNPFMKNGGDGYPIESPGPQYQGETKHFDVKSGGVGDGGLSWRLKALKRAREQAEREGRNLEKVVEERWGSLADMTLSVSAKRAAHSRAHLHAIKERRRINDNVNPEEECKETTGGDDNMQNIDDTDVKRVTTGNRDYLKDVSVRDTRMKAPLVTDSLSWKRRKSELHGVMRVEDKQIVQAAASALNRFQNDGSFIRTFNEKQQHQDAVGEHGSQQQMERSVASHVDSPSSTPGISTEGMSAHQVAAKALQLRLRGKIKEADELLNQLQNMKEKEKTPMQYEASRPQEQILKSIVGDYNHRMRKGESADAGLAENILHNKQYNRVTSVDEEYESVGGSLKESKKAKRKVSTDKEAKQAIRAHKRIITQEERCQFCFNNPTRPKHLTISIANTCYLLLPPWEPLVEGHCLLVPMQHEGSSRNVDEDVWQELRNYKKRLVEMFKSQGKDVLFMETASNLSKQRRHCLVECIPLPPNVAKQAPLYFKKAIDEAEDEWSQHNAKKLIDTKERGLRGCIPKNFPYFHVEFGLGEGFVHVIDDEKDFRNDLGRNVVIGMLKLPEEEMHRRRKAQSYEQQNAATTEFRKAWDPFDWTKLLD